jgi:hypothetical protein
MTRIIIGRDTDAVDDSWLPLRSWGRPRAGGLPRLKGGVC